MRHDPYLSQRELLDIDRRRDSAHDRFMCERASEGRTAGAWGQLLLAIADADGVEDTGSTTEGRQR